MRFEDDVVEEVRQWMDRMLEEAGKGIFHYTTESGWHIPVDIYETEKEIVVLIEIAGLDIDKIRLFLENKRIVISGVRENPFKGEKLKVHQMEIDFGYFQQVINLPAAVKDTEVKSSYKDGFLRIYLSKRYEGPKKIIIENG